MADQSSSSRSQPRQIEALLAAAKSAFDPSLDSESHDRGLYQYNDLIASFDTRALLPLLNSLVKPNALPAWLRDPLLQTLTLLPLRPDGVRETLEFLFAIHPSSSSTMAGADQPQKSGASITHEAVAIAIKLLSSVPSSMSADDWFNGISGQLFALLDGGAGPDLSRTAAQIIGFGVLGKKEFGAPGAPGWNIFVQPLLEQVNPSLVAETAMKDGKNPKTNDEEVVDLRRLHIIVTSQCLYLALGRLEALIISNPSPSLCKRVTRPILMQLWCLASWASPSVETEKELCRPARNLLKAYFRLFGTVESILPLTQNIMCTGSTDTTAPTWRYRLNKDGLVEIATYQEAAAALPEAAFHLDEIDHKAAVMVDTIISACSNEHISSIFLDLLRRWLNSAGRQSGKEILLASPKDEAGSHIQYIVELSMLQKLMEKAPEKLVGHFDQLLEVICQVMHADKWADLGDELLAVVLSLLNMVLTSTSFRKSEIDAKDLKTIEESLVRIENSERPEVSATARNLAMILRYHDEIEASDEFKAAPSIRQVEDNKTYNLAMSYITGDGDNPPPVVAEGLNLLSGLIMAESPILDITAVMVLMSSLLKENEDFIYLRVIKVFTQLAKKHPRSTIQEILDNYLDAQEKLSTDVRLRFGEALLQVIERLGEAFAGDVAKQACETLLSIAGRRGHRLKAMAKEEKEARLKEMKRRREEADGEKRRKLETGASHRDEDDGGDLPGDEELVSEEEQYRQDVLARIIQGWESKRGSEDVRMRTSALSIFGSALETNLGGIDPATISDGVEVSLSVLTLERGLEHIILRRAAVLMILSLVRALDQAREAKRALGFGLSGESRRGLEQALGYIADTDEDGLVREQARDAAESLENWQLGSFLRPRDETSVAQGINQLSGLRVRPETVIEDETGRLRPRIEEIE